VLSIELKYNDDAEPAIRGLKRESKPGLRKFCGVQDIPKVLGGMGTAILSTSGGVLSGKEARRRKLGGERICTIW
jgi:small subunit ribosomal protein S8